MCFSFTSGVRYQEDTVKQGKRVDKWPQRLSRLTAIHDIFSAEEILEGTSRIKPTLSDEQRSLMELHKPDLYVFFCYSTKLWDKFNDNVLRLRQKMRVLRGGLQLATQTMPQGELITIPLTSSIGYQNTTHVIVHFRNADPDLGRKGFQPELTNLAETLATASVTAFKRWNDRLRKDSGNPQDPIESEKHNWIIKQEEHAKVSPLQIPHSQLFNPEYSLPIISTPTYEQDVIALFHQLLATGVIRGIKILATEEHKTYDGIYRIEYEQDKLDRYIYNVQQNPLGIPEMNFRAMITEPRILEYKYNVDGLIDDFDKEIKFPQHIRLVIAWSMGEQWKKYYEIVPLLHSDHIFDRHYHGTTHRFLDDRTGDRFEAIILHELFEYLRNPEEMQLYFQKKYIDYE